MWIKQKINKQNQINEKITAFKRIMEFNYYYNQIT